MSDEEIRTIGGDPDRLTREDALALFDFDRIEREISNRATRDFPGATTSIKHRNAAILFRNLLIEVAKRSVVDADQEGWVSTSVPFLAMVAGLTATDCLAAMALLDAVDFTQFSMSFRISRKGLADVLASVGDDDLPF